MRTVRKACCAIAVICATVAVVSVGEFTPQKANAAVSQTWIDEQVSFISTHQLASGAILSTDTKINPYFANNATLGLIKANTTSSKSAAYKWMTWYLGHLNAAATSVPANSVFDYNYDKATGIESSTGNFDSVDSYASTTLNVAYAAWQSGDTALRNLVTDNIASYEAIANVLDYSAPQGVRIATGASAGLTIAKPSYAIAYTMDNVEVFSGLRDFAALEGALGRTSQQTYYSSWADTSKSSILAKLWNPTNNNWDWAYGNTSNTGVFYAQATAQVWPIIFGVVDPTDPKAIAGWNAFTAAWPTWYSNGIPDSFPWVSIARASQIMGDPTHATASLTDIRNRYAPNFTAPTSCGATSCGNWYDNEAGWFIQAALKI